MKISIKKVKDGIRLQMGDRTVVVHDKEETESATEHSSFWQLAMFASLSAAIKATLSALLTWWTGH